METLTPSRRSELRTEAHALRPVVIVGDKGLTDSVVAEIGRALDAHELIKVRAVTDDRQAREAWMREICERLDAHPVQQIGKVLVIYRENPEPPPPPKAAPARKAPSPRKRGPVDSRPPPRASGSKLRGNDERRAKGDAKRTSHPRSRTPSPPLESAPRRRRRSTSR